MRNRIKELMREKDVTRQELAERIDAHPVTISKLISGTMRLSDVWLDKIADALEVRPADLIEKRDEPTLVPVVGLVGAGAEIFTIDDHAQGAGFEEVEAPANMLSEAVALIVRGDSMRPAMRDGDTLFYDFKLEGDLTSLISEECVVRLADGRTFVKELAKGSTPGLWTLFSHNDAPIYDVVVEWAAKVKFIKRR